MDVAQAIAVCEASWPQMTLAQKHALRSFVCPRSSDLVRIRNNKVMLEPPGRRRPRFARDFLSYLEEDDHTEWGDTVCAWLINPNKTALLAIDSSTEKYECTYACISVKLPSNPTTGDIEVNVWECGKDVEGEMVHMCKLELQIQRALAFVDGTTLEKIASCVAEEEFSDYVWSGYRPLTDEEYQKHANLFLSLRGS